MTSTNGSCSDKKMSSANENHTSTTPSADSPIMEPATKRLKSEASNNDKSDSTERLKLEASCNDNINTHNSSDTLVPQLKDDGITQEDVETAIRVLNAVAKLDPKHRKKQQDTDNGLDMYKQKNLRPFRKALASCLELHQKTMFNGKSELEHFERRKQERSIKRQKASERYHQKNYIASTALRKGRVEKLEKLKQEAQQEEEAKLLLMQTMIPDGHVESSSTTPLLENGDAKPKTLPAKMRSCYVCKVRYRELHAFYDQLCPSCAPLNWEKRHQTCDLKGKVAVVTGSRVKIGFQTTLKLLRAGATVVATTRFPNSAAEAYQKEEDFQTFQDRLHIYGLDLRDVTGLEAFTRFLKQKYGKTGIDILINNACQTVRRPRGYYIPMMEKEQQLWKESGDAHKALLDGCAEFERVRRQLVVNQQNGNDASQVAQLKADEETTTTTPMIQMVMENDTTATATTTEGTKDSSVSTSNGQVVVSTVNEESEATPFETTGVSHSAAMSQMVILPEDVGVSDSVLPPGLSDINGQQLDLRSTNSWLLKMEEVSTPEIMECMFINAIAPFVLNSRLKPLMAFPNDDTRPDRFIINVSAMEGKFYRYKMPNHPHTNMAKAALNMMTRTSAEDLSKSHRIYMNAVDTGWINDENPLERANKTAETNLFQTPIDEIDAAARILDPIFTGIAAGREGDKLYGKFLKDFKETEW
jgi:NAD(P)-dependent dehydrogenase (short-subunit alcohol dehydrogenase family)